MQVGSIDNEHFNHFFILDCFLPIQVGLKVLQQFFTRQDANVA